MRAVIATGLMLLAGACDCGTHVSTVTPQMGVQPESLEFGPVVVGEAPVAKAITVRALTSAGLELQAKIVEPDSPFAIRGEVPAIVDPLGSVEIVIVFTPPSLDTFAGTLDITSNDPDLNTGHRTLLLSGQGRTPQITVSPGQLDLSAVACGPAASSPRCTDTRSFRVSNPGDVPLHLGVLTIAPDGTDTAPPANLALASLVSNTTIPPGQDVEVKVRWRPAPAQAASGAADYRAWVVVPSNDPAHPESKVLLGAHADPNAAPTACLTLASVTRLAYSPNGPAHSAEVSPSEYTDDTVHPGVPWLRPAMTAHLTADPCSTDPEGDTLTYTWGMTFTSSDVPPSTGTARVQPVDDPPGSQRFARAELQADLPGDYDLTLVVADSLHQTASASLRLHVVPEDFRVALTWGDTDPTADRADLDLHVVGPVEPGTGDGLFTCRDAFWGNARTNWDFAPFDAASPADDLRYLRDAWSTSVKQEQVAASRVPPGARFRVAVHYFALDSGVSHAVTPSLVVSLLGHDQAPLAPTQPLLTPGDVWFGATVEFPVGAQPVVTAEQERDTHPFGASDVPSCP